MATEVQLSDAELLELVGEMAGEERAWDAVWVTEMMDRFRDQARLLADPGVRLIARERRRVVDKEGFGPEHDDLYTKGELWRAAASYLEAVEDYEEGSTGVRPSIEPPRIWPWDPQWWKPKTTTPNLVRSGQLIAAELGRRARHRDTFLALVVEACVAGGAERDYAAGEVANSVPDFLAEEGIEVGHHDRDWGVSGAAALADELVLQHLEGQANG
jgi:hypothetical protein